MYFCDHTRDILFHLEASTNEIEGCALERDVVVFGVDIPVAEDEAGMAFIVGDEESIDVIRPMYP